MVLEWVVTNVVAFGAFVEIGVHQDGLGHISQLADRYVGNHHLRKGSDSDHMGQVSPTAWSWKAGAPPWLKSRTPSP